MAHRQIVDKQNQVWDVWEVVPDHPRGPRISNPGRPLVVPPELQAGWLAFQCGEQRRRIAPLPDGWIDLSDDALLDMMAGATALRPRIRAS